MKFRNSFHPYAAVTILFWALAFVLTRLALRDLTSYSLGFLRYFVASAVLAAALAVLRVRPPSARDIMWFALSGLLGFSLYIILFNIGTAAVTAATSSLIIATAPVMTALLAALCYGERLRPYQWTAIAVQFAGIALLTAGGDALSVNRGVLWLLAAALSASLYNIVLRRLARDYQALQITAYSILAGTLFLTVFAPGAVSELRTAPPRVILLVVTMGVFSSAVAYLAWTKALSLAEKTSMAGNYMFFTPVITAILGIFMAGEVPDGRTVASGIVILGGALLFNRESLFHKRLPAPPEE